MYHKTGVYILYNRYYKWRKWQYICKWGTFPHKQTDDIYSDAHIIIDKYNNKAIR